MSERSGFTHLERLLRGDPRVVAAVVFGSVARGQARAGSDLDLAVRWRDPAARSEVDRDRWSWLGRLAMAAGRDIHLVDLQTADPALVRRIAGEGTVLLDCDPEGTRRLIASRLLAYFDWEYARRLIAVHQREELGRG